MKFVRNCFDIYVISTTLILSNLLFCLGKCNATNIPIEKELREAKLIIIQQKYDISHLFGWFGLPRELACLRAWYARMIRIKSGVVIRSKSKLYGTQSDTDVHSSAVPTTPHSTHQLLQYSQYSTVLYGTTVWYYCIVLLYGTTVSYILHFFCCLPARCCLQFKHPTEGMLLN